jgi:hypothetical protein
MSALIADVDSLTIPAEDARPGDTIREDDGRVRTVRAVKFGASTVLIMWADGVGVAACDVFRRSYPLTLVDTY